MHVGVARVEVHLVDSRCRSETCEDAFPGLAAVGGLVQPAIPARAPQRPLRAATKTVSESRGSTMAIMPMCSDSFSPTFFQLAPPSVGLVDAVAERDAALAVVLTGAGPDDVRVVRIEPQAADRVRRLAVEHRLPGRAAVGGLPDAARGGGREVALGVLGVDREVDDAPRGQRRPERAEREPLQRRGGGLGLVFLLLFRFLFLGVASAFRRLVGSLVVRRRLVGRRVDFLRLAGAVFDVLQREAAQREASESEERERANHRNRGLRPWGESAGGRAGHVKRNGARWPPIPRLVRCLESNAARLRSGPRRSSISVRTR